MSDEHTDGARPSRPSLYGLDANQSAASVFEDVEMAHDELYAGPMAESLPTSTAAFSHRRSRADSMASFAYYTDNDEEQDRAASPESTVYRRADDGDSVHFAMDQAETDQLLAGSYASRRYLGRTSTEDDAASVAVADDDDDEEEYEDESEPTSSEQQSTAGRDDYVLHRRSSTVSRTSVHAGLLRRGSGATETGSVGTLAGGRTTQKTYLESEDLYMVIAGFTTSTTGLALYTVLCIVTGGLAWLLFRWIPRWQVRIVGRPCTLDACTWVVVENQWNEMAILDVDVARYNRPLSTVFGPTTATKTMRYVADDDDPDPLLPELRGLSYRYVRFFYHPQRDKFVHSAGWKDPAWDDVRAVRAVRAGVTESETVLRARVFGANLIDIEQKSVARLLVDEVFHPFYVFQIASLVLWSLDEYYYYAVAIFCMSFGSIAATLVETRSTMRRLRAISRFECEVRVLRDGFWRTVLSSDLVPGDVYEVSDPSLAQFPADSLLLSGDCIVNESMLTGESVPVSKVPATNATLRQLDLGAATVLPAVARHFLFCGTKIVRARKPHDGHDGGEDGRDEDVALALVVRTGFNTTKGSLVRSMLFPKPSGFKFYRDSFRYISVMACIALVGFFASFVNFVRLGLAWHLIVVRALDLITIVVPPALPATLTIGTNFALSRLRRRQVFCISPQRVNVGGKLDLMCFDKTGTLTEEGLDVLGVHVVDPAARTFSGVLDAAALVPRGPPASQRTASQRTARTARTTRTTAVASYDDACRAALFTMATCHSLRSVDGELMGDPLDLKMFEFSQWSFDEGEQQGTRDTPDDDDQTGLAPSVARPPPHAVADLDTRPPPVASPAQSFPFELGIIRSFEFVSHLRRASVVVRVFGQPSGDVYVKGAPECMRDICRPASLPDDYDALLSHYTHKGYRVIGCATKHMPKLSWVRAQKMRREDAETGLDFVGFIVFENKLKPTTTPVLDGLLASGIGCVMVTGDNILTAMSVARESHLVAPTARCFVPRFAHGHAQDPNAELQWESIDDATHTLDPHTLMPVMTTPFADRNDYAVAVSGDVFRWIVDYARPALLERVLVRGRVFARMSPDEKCELVERLQSIGYCVGFCGDGANDCAALKAADVGISLSEAEASVAAPFTSRVFDIRCVPDVIREGRASLVTSFSCFKYMSLYSAIQFTSVSLLYASASNLGDFQFLFIDLALILPIAVFMSWAGPCATLGRKRPTANLVSRKVLAPLLGQMLVCIAVQVVAFVAVRRQPWFAPPVIDPDHSNSRNSENTALFLVSCFEYILSGIVLNAGAPFRQGMWHNWPFVATVAAALAATVYMVLAPAPWVATAMELTYLSPSFKGLLLALGAGYLAVALVADRWVLPAVADLIGRVKLAITQRPKTRKQYKVIAEAMQ